MANPTKKRKISICCERFVFPCQIVIILLLLGLIILLLYVLKLLPELFRREVFWVAVGSVGALVSIIITCSTFAASQKEQRKRNTYEIFAKFKDDVFDLENKIDKAYVDEALREYKERKAGASEKWITVKEYLTKVERVAACVNASILDEETIYNMGGPYMIKMYGLLKDIIEEKRTEEGRISIYEEFEKMVCRLEKVKERRKGK